jgi:hypothetical protein
METSQIIPLARMGWTVGASLSDPQTLRQKLQRMPNARRRETHRENDCQTNLTAIEVSSVTVVMSLGILLICICSISVPSVHNNAESSLIGWTYRKSHVIDAAYRVGTDYPTGITVNSGSGTDSSDDVYPDYQCKTDFRDICSAKSDGSASLSCWKVSSEVRVNEANLTKAIYSAWIASDKTVYIGTVDTVWKSTDGGATWNSSKTVSNCTYIKMVYVAANGYAYFSPGGDSLADADRGIWRSTDSGSTWTRVLALGAFSGSYIEWGIDEDNEGRLFAGVYTDSTTVGNARIYRSIDNGATWASVYYDSDGRHVHDVKVDRSNDYVYATVGDVTLSWNASYTLRSTDHGDSWTTILSSMPQCVAICVIPGYRLFGDDSGTGCIYRTSDDSSSSTVYNGGISGWMECNWIRSDSATGRLFAGFQAYGAGPYVAGIQMSEDNGTTWQLYRPLTCTHAWDGTEQCSNIVNGTAYYQAISGGTTQYGVKLRVDFAAEDLNFDGVVDILDVAIVARAFGTKPGDPNWNLIADLDKNGMVNIVDVAKVAKEFGKSL